MVLGQPGRLNRCAAAVAALLSGCAAPDGVPAWALDTLTLAPGDAAEGLPGPVTALQAWTLYDARWDRGRLGRHLVCGALVSLDTVPEDTPCDGCAPAWRVIRAEVQDTDCDDATAGHPVLTAITGVALGPVEPSLPPAPVTGALGGWIRTDATGWVPHGWAWPQGADTGSASTGPWDGVRAFTLWPAYAWSLTDDTSDRDTDAAIPASPSTAPPHPPPHPSWHGH